MFGRDEKQEGKTGGQSENAGGQAGSENANGQAGSENANDQPKEKEAGKTTPDEGKNFKDNTVFVCVQDCFQHGTRYRPGDTVTGKKCPPWFEVRKDKEEEDKE